MIDSLYRDIKYGIYHHYHEGFALLVAQLGINTLQVNYFFIYL